MAVSIRLRREGARNRPYYKVVVADSRSPRDGKFIEIIGTYDPKKPDHNSTLQLDRIEHWISKGAQPSDTVRSLIKKNKKQSDQAPSPSADTTSAPPESAAPVAAPEPVVDVETPAPTTLAEETAAVSESAEPTPVAEESTAVAEESKAVEDSPSTPPPLPS